MIYKIFNIIKGYYFRVRWKKNAELLLLKSYKKLFKSMDIESKYEILLTSYPSSLSEPQKNEHGEYRLWLHDPDGNIIRLTEKIDNNFNGIEFEGISIMTNKLKVEGAYKFLRENMKKRNRTKTDV